MKVPITKVAPFIPYNDQIIRPKKKLFSLENLLKKFWTSSKST